MKTFSSREFNQDSSRVKKAATREPVLITDRGRPSHVLMSFDDFRRLGGERKSVAELLFSEGAAEVELILPERSDRGRSARFD